MEESDVLCFPSVTCGHEEKHARSEQDPAQSLRISPGNLDFLFEFVFRQNETLRLPSSRFLTGDLFAKDSEFRQ